MSGLALRLLDCKIWHLLHFRREDTVSRYAAIGITDLVVHWPRANDPYKADYSIFERIFAR